MIVILAAVPYVLMIPKETGNQEITKDETVEVETEKQNETKRFNLFKKSSVNPADMYGLSNENNILGKSIDDILEGYTEGKDYTVEKGKSYKSYTFKAKHKYYDFENVYLVIYTSADSTEIEDFAYEFRYAKSNTRARINIAEIKRDLLRYLDADPHYTYMDNEYGTVETDEKTFSNLMAQDYVSLYQIEWKGKNITAVYSYSLENKEATNWCAIGFSKN